MVDQKAVASILLYLLEANGGEMPRRCLRGRTDLRYAIIDPVLEELERQGKIEISLGEKGGSISLLRKS